MTSKIKVDNITNQSDSNIVNKCGTTITLGASGDTITLASGASQSGFGRTGTVDWDTTAKTAAFTAVSGNGYFVDTTSGAITVTLPASPSAGDIVYVKDYTGTFGNNACTVARNGSNIRGGTNNFTLELNNGGAVFIYVDGTEGWQVFVDGSDSDVQATFMVATGGTITEDGDFRIHTFTGPGTFTVTCEASNTTYNNVDYTIVAGGGGGGAGVSGGPGGGGAAGGFRESKCATTSGCWTASPLANSTSIPVTAQGYPITVGGGGSGVPGTGTGTSGANSVFSTITSAGGGGGGGASCNAGNGGSGGGAGGPASAGTGNTPPTSPPQGNNGGTAAAGTSSTGGGGGGASAVGGNGNTCGVAGDGGNGVSNSITGSSVARAGGGGGTFENYPGNVGTGGSGGGGQGGHITNCGTVDVPAAAGTVNTGGGGGGSGGATPAFPFMPGTAASGGSGIVIIRYKFQ
jgi:hypothetical protein